MKFGDTRTPRYVVRVREQKWRRWYDQLGRRSAVIRFAKDWAELMEQAHSPGVHIYQLAARTLGELESRRRRLSDEQFRTVIQILRECWYYGSGINRWANENGYKKES